ncbi:MAG: YfhO family protein, partial [bacterium]
TIKKRISYKDLLFITILFLLTIIFFHEVVFLKKFFQEDFLGLNYPWKSFSATSIKKGQLPLWNPYEFSGKPFLADIQTAVLYPFNLLLTIFVYKNKLGAWVLEYQVLFHFFLFGIFMYLYVLELTKSRYSSFIAALACMFNGFMIPHAHHVNIIHSGIWIPLVFLFWEKFLKEHKYIYVVLCGITISLSILGGQPHVTFFILFAICFYFLFILIVDFEKLLAKKRLNTTILSFLLVLVIGFGLAAVQLLPTSEFSNLIYRYPSNTGGTLTYEEATTRRSLDFNKIGSLLIPNNPDFRNYLSPRDYLYFGIFPLFLALIGIFALRNKYTIFFVLLACTSLLLAFGKNAPLYQLIFLVPGVNRFRIPTRFIYLFHFSMSVLAAYGIKSLLEKGKAKKNINIRLFLMILGIFSLLLIGGISLAYKQKNFWLTFYNFKEYVALCLIYLISAIVLFYLSLKRLKFNQWILILIPFLIFIDLYIFNKPYTGDIHPEKRFAKNEKIFDYIKNQKGLFRLDPRSGIHDPFIIENYSVLYNIFSTSGYNPMILKWYQNSNFESSNVAQMLNSKYVITNSLWEKLKGARSGTESYLKSNDYLKYFTEDYDDSSWQETSLPGFWETKEKPLFEPFFTTIPLPPYFLTSNLKFTYNGGTDIFINDYFVKDITWPKKPDENLLYYPEQITPGQERLIVKFRPCPNYDGLVCLRGRIEIPDWLSKQRTRIIFEQGVNDQVALFINGKQVINDLNSKNKKIEIELEEKLLSKKNNLFTIFIYNIQGFGGINGQIYLVGEDGQKLDLSRVKWRSKKLEDGLPHNLIIDNEALPRAYLVYKANIENNNKPRELTFDPKEVVSSNNPNLTQKEVVHISEYGINKINLTTNTITDAYLVLSEVYYPGWRAFIDGREEEVLKANNILRAVSLPKGNHTVIFKYDPLSFKIGLYISLSILVLIVSYLVVLLIKRQI